MHAVYTGMSQDSKYHLKAIDSDGRGLGKIWEVLGKAQNNEFVNVTPSLPH